MFINIHVIKKIVNCWLMNISQSEVKTIACRGDVEAPDIQIYKFISKKFIRKPFTSTFQHFSAIWRLILKILGENMYTEIIIPLPVEQ